MTTTWIDRPLRKHEVFIAFLTLAVIYAFPIIHADYLFIDDQWRSLMLFDDAWVGMGRYFSEGLYHALTLTPSMPNIFPLPLLLSLLAICAAMTNLVFYFYFEVNIAKCLVVLPLLCNPFFLGNLSYQYDGPTMVCSVAAMATVVTLQFTETRLTYIVPPLFIVLGLGFYQPSLSILTGLVCLEFLLKIARGSPPAQLRSTAVRRAAQLILGVAAYYFTVYALAHNDRDTLVPWDQHWIPTVGTRLWATLGKIGLLITPGTGWLCAVLTALASTGALILVRRPLTRSTSEATKVGILLVIAALVPVLVVVVPGMLLILAEENHLDARQLMGFSISLILLFGLARTTLAILHPRAPLFLVIPCLYMFSLSYMYGQILNTKKDYETSLSNHIGYDLTSYPQLRDIREYGLIASSSVKSDWLPDSAGVLRLTPLMDYLLTDGNYPLPPTRFARLGISNVYWASASMQASLAEDKGLLVVDNLRYRIYKVGDKGIIQLRHLSNNLLPW